MVVLNPHMGIIRTVLLSLTGELPGSSCNSDASELCATWTGTQHSATEGSVRVCSGETTPKWLVWRRESEEPTRCFISSIAAATLHTQRR